MLDATIGRALMNNTPKVGYELHEELVYNNYQWSYEISQTRLALAVIELDVASQIVAIHQRIDRLPKTNAICENCAKNHASVNYPMGEELLALSKQYTWETPTNRIICT